MAQTRASRRTTRMWSWGVSLPPNASHHMRTHSWRRNGCAIAARSTASFHSPSRARKAVLSETRSTEYMTESGRDFPLFACEEIEIQRFCRAHHFFDRVAIFNRLAGRVAEPSRERWILDEAGNRIRQRV